MNYKLTWRFSASAERPFVYLRYARDRRGGSTSHEPKIACHTPGCIPSSFSPSLCMLPSPPFSLPTFFFFLFHHYRELAEGERETDSCAQRESLSIRPSLLQEGRERGKEGPFFAGLRPAAAAATRRRGGRLQPEPEERERERERLTFSLPCMLFELLIQFW